MDINIDIDGKFLQQFSSMGTTDREVLVSEFGNFFDNVPKTDLCAFFLDMNNW